MSPAWQKWRKSSLVAARFNLGLAHWGRGDQRRAFDYFAENVATLGGGQVSAADVAAYPATNSHSAVNNRCNGAWCLAELGEFARATAYGQEALRIAESLDHPYTLTLAHFLVGGVHYRRGDTARAIGLLERSVQLCDTWDFPFFTPWAVARLGATYTLAGRNNEGIRMLERAAEFTAAGETRAEAALQAAWLGEAYLAAGRLGDATRLAAHAVELARAYNERAGRGWTLRLLGEIASRREPLEADQAEGHYREALELAKELEMRPLRAHCHLGLGKLYRRMGHLDEAHSELATAVAMLREMGMTFWLPEAENELAREPASLPVHGVAADWLASPKIGCDGRSSPG